MLHSLESRSALLSFVVDVIDDDDAYVGVLTRWLTRKNCLVHEHRGVEALSPDPGDTVIIEPSPNGVPRLEVVERLVQATPEGQVIAVSAYPSMWLTFACARAGVKAFLPKPAPPQMIWQIMVGEEWDPTLHCESLSLKQLEHEYIRLLLCYCAGNVSATARRLGIRRSTLQRKLRKHPELGHLKEMGAD